SQTMASSPGLNCSSPNSVLQKRCWNLAARALKPATLLTSRRAIRVLSTDCTSCSSRLITGSRLLFWLQALTSELRVRGYTSGVDTCFSIRQPMILCSRTDNFSMTRLLDVFCPQPTGLRQEHQRPKHSGRPRTGVERRQAKGGPGPVAGAVGVEGLEIPAGTRPVGVDGAGHTVTHPSLQRHAARAGLVGASHRQPGRADR